MMLCILACMELFDGRWKCFVEVRPECTQEQYVCVPSERVLCEPWVKVLGPWSPYVPKPERNYIE